MLERVWIEVFHVQLVCLCVHCLCLCILRRVWHLWVVIAGFGGGVGAVVGFGRDKGIQPTSVVLYGERSVCVSTFGSIVFVWEMHVVVNGKSKRWTGTLLHVYLYASIYSTIIISHFQRWRVGGMAPHSMELMWRMCAHSTPRTSIPNPTVIDMRFMHIRHPVDV